MRSLFLKTSDRQSIHVSHYDQGFDKVVILAHGFFNTKDAYLFCEIAKALACQFDVIAFDFRGHGKSSGLFTWTSKECEDLSAVIDYAQTFKYQSIALMGFSLGAAISLIEAASNPHVSAVVAVSAPSDFWRIDYHFWKPSMLDDLKLNLGHKGKGKGVRPSHLWHPKVAPVDVVKNISPRPILFVHGANDWLINVRHSRILFEEARNPKKLVVLDKLGHAETMFDQNPDVFMGTCLEWLKSALTAKP